MFEGNLVHVAVLEFLDLQVSPDTVADDCADACDSKHCTQVERR